MKNVGSYAFLFRNSISKTTWKQYGFEDFHEQTNLIFVVLLFIMEQSLKDEPCTMDDISGFIDMVNMKYFKKPLSYDECKELSDFIINVILGNQGKTMYFKGYDFKDEVYKDIHVSFINNKPIYIDNDVRRTSYYLTEDGYNLMLSTLEMESNMLLSIHEMIFKLHIEKASYDKAVDDVKNIFNQLRIQYQRIREAIRKIKQNALNYSVLDYKVLLEENLETISDTSKKFAGYRENIRERVRDLEEKNINIKKLDKEDSENLKNLKIIEEYLNRAIDEHQQILKSHFELKSLYTKELEDLSQMTLIKRFNLRSELFDPILKEPGHLQSLEYFIRPLLNKNADKTYNINKSVEIQKPIRAKQIEEDEEVLEIDDEKWQEERHQKQRERLLLYNESLLVILTLAKKRGNISLSEIKEYLENKYSQLIPTVEIFKEIIIEMLRNSEIEISELKEERRDYLLESSNLEFQLNESILEIMDNHSYLADINKIITYKIEGADQVIFENVNSSSGTIKRVLCSDISFEIS